MFWDIGIGIILGILFSGSSASASFIVSGILFSLLPDVDFLWHLLRKRSVQKIDHTHRDLLHYPLLYIILGTLAAWAIQPSFALLFGIASLLHFIHDSVGIGWGIQWLYPFSRSYFKAFSEKDGRFSWNPMTSWTPAEQERVAHTTGDPYWFKNIYFRLTPISIIEFSCFGIAIIFLLMRR